MVDDVPHKQQLHTKSQISISTHYITLDKTHTCSKQSLFQTLFVSCMHAFSFYFVFSTLRQSIVNVTPPPSTAVNQFPIRV
ncbi:hypothetical protein QVD17_17442 [Tagetes erecta]|uniref:Uncharacterized protein n=1 Tax=Tagetes erecta TaxID=13708 RepID=A0AAD8KW22_TARER|nr:hypothetical protein QVD17_17442 [Tagetes erecta]